MNDPVEEPTARPLDYAPPVKGRTSRALYLAIGWMFVGLAALGLFLPLLPTTPFLLLASSCFLRSSPRLQRWLASSRWFGPMIRDWDEHKAVRRPVKVLAVAMVSAVIVLAAVRDLHWGVRTLIVVLGGVGLVVVWRLPVIPARREAEGMKREDVTT